MDVGEIITRKIGPLPVWAYGAIVAAGAWGWYYVTGKAKLNIPPAATPSDMAADAALPDVVSNPFGDGSGGTTTVPSTGTPSSNQAWFMLASSYLLGFGYDGVAVTNALTKYLQGEQLTIPERALVNQAVSRYGAPPEGAPVSPGGVPTTPIIPPVSGGVSRGGTPVPRRIDYSTLLDGGTTTTTDSGTTRRY